MWGIESDSGKIFSYFKEFTQMVGVICLVMVNLAQANEQVKAAWPGKSSLEREVGLVGFSRLTIN